MIVEITKSVVRALYRISAIYNGPQLCVGLKRLDIPHWVSGRKPTRGCSFGGLLVTGYPIVRMMVHWWVESVRMGANPPVLIVQLKKRNKSLQLIRSRAERDEPNTRQDAHTKPKEKRQPTRAEHID